MSLRTKRVYFTLLNLYAFILFKATASSFLEVSSQGQSTMMCDCEKVRCNCVKRCDCKMPDEGGVFLQTEERHIPIEWQSAFLQEESGDLSTHQLEETTGGVMQQLECDCDKVKCNCLKHCECNSGVGGSGASLTNIQINHQKDDVSITNAVGTKPLAPDMPTKPISHKHQRHKAHAQITHRQHHHHHHHIDEDNSDSQ